MVANLTAAIAKAAGDRRRRLAKAIGDGVVFLLAAPAAVKSRDVEHHPYRQDSYLRYLSGCDEARTALLLRAAGGELREEIFFCRPRDATAERWEGRRLSPATARRRLQIADAMEIGRFEEILRERASAADALHYLPGADERADFIVADMARRRRSGRSGAGATRYVDVSAILDGMRVFKDKTEISLIRAACELTCDGVLAAMRAAMWAKNEREVDAAIGATYRAGGGFHAFPPIVGRGDNACVLHYAANNAALGKGNGLLLDTGCELNGYAGDVTRSFPISGRWEGEFRAVYDIVLTAQQAAIRAARPGARWRAVELAAARKLAAGLRSLGLRRGSVAGILRRRAERQFYPHRAGHFLGLDVHDVGGLREDSVLAPGMVLTIEPGMYFPAAEVSARWGGIGARIEDDILITAEGNDILTNKAPKKPRQISEWMRG